MEAYGHVWVDVAVQTVGVGAGFGVAAGAACTGVGVGAAPLLPELVGVGWVLVEPVAVAAGVGDVTFCVPVPGVACPGVGVACPVVIVAPHALGW